MGRKYVTFVVHLLSFFAIECQKMTSTRLDMDPAYTSLLPASSQYYITELTGIHRMICFLLCIQHSDTCAGTLVNVDTRQCELMRTHMNGLAMDGNKTGCSYWAVKNRSDSDPRWSEYNSHFYTRITTVLSYQDADKLDANLVVIPDQSENRMITDVLLKDVYCENTVDCGTWTSANDISTEGEFVWRSLDSEGPINYSNWDVNPDDVILHDDLDCVDIFYTESWNTSPCTDLKPFICEKDNYS